MTAQIIPINFAADSAGQSEAAPRDAAMDLGRVGLMADTLTNAQREVARAEGELEDAEAALRRLSHEEFPDLLREVGLAEVVLSDKRTIVMVDDVQCGISEDDKAAAHKWLRDNRFGGLIKSSVIVEFGKGEDEEMSALLAVIAAHFKAREQERVAEVNEGVHWQTLKAFIKEQRALGTVLPDEFNVFPFTTVDVKHPRGATGFKLKRIYKKK